MLAEISKNTEKYKREYPKKRRKERGQFFTSVSTACYMANMVSGRPEVSILDAGSGNGILSAALIEHLCDYGCRSISVTLYENDCNILPLLKKNIGIMRDYCGMRSVEFSSRIVPENFLTSDISDTYDVVISNPPYKKIPKQSEESAAMTQYVHGQPNLYGLFMCKAVDLLKDNGDFIFITPRSWMSGDYFEIVRRHIIRSIGIDRLHLFDSRNESFSSEEVLQETVITHGIKSKQIANVIISVSNTDTFDNIDSFTVPYKTCIGVSKHQYIFIPANTAELENLVRISGYKHTLSDLGYRFKTGPVVEFRSEGNLRYESSERSIPMVRSLHIKDGQFVFPDPQTDKPQWFDSNKANMRLKNGVMVLLKRITAKEEAKRLQACVYTPDRFDKEYITIENHVNYLVKANGEDMTEDEAILICRMLNSDDLDIYFRSLNGSTQINATEINSLPIELELEAS